MGITNIEFNGLSFEENDAIVTRAQKILLLESRKLELSEKIHEQIKEIESNIQIDSFKFFFDDEIDFTPNEILQIIKLINICIENVTQMSHSGLSLLLNENISDERIKSRIINVLKQVIIQLNSINN